MTLLNKNTNQYLRHNGLNILYILLLYRVDGEIITFNYGVAISYRRVVALFYKMNERIDTVL